MTSPWNEEIATGTILHIEDPTEVDSYHHLAAYFGDSSWNIGKARQTDKNIQCFG